MFGYEHREILAVDTIPREVKNTAARTTPEALIIPLTLLVIISGAQVIILLRCTKPALHHLGKHPDLRKYS
ncbi:MAG: hypothetical protein U5J63_04865 [Fodinibius sp.]|nr:hypothetical protein [Fodinibius sp.]